MQKLRVVDSKAKVQATVDVAISILEKEPAVVIFTSFQDVANAVQAGWDGELLTGETPANKRQGKVDNFQNPDNDRLGPYRDQILSKPTFGFDP